MNSRQQAAGSRQQAVRRLYRMFFAACCLLPAACYRQDMARQPSYHWPDQPSDFFPDGRGNRPLEPGTVARGHLRDDSAQFTGQTGESTDPTAEPNYVTEFPFPVDEPTLRRGRERFNIYCAICHGRAGDGDGKVVQRGYLKPPSFHTDLSRGYTRWKKDVSLRDVPVGYIFEVISKGYGGMPEYAEMVPPNDRWAIIAYLRALQFSRNVSADKLTNEDRRHLEAGGARGDR
jgi:mono/diheme cytochrome c family protein